MQKETMRMRKSSFVETSLESNQSDGFDPNEQKITVVADITHNDEPHTSQSVQQDKKKDGSFVNMDSHLGSVKKAPVKRQGRRMPPPRVESEEITVLSSEEVPPAPPSLARSRILSPITRALSSSASDDSPGKRKGSKSYRERLKTHFDSGKKNSESPESGEGKPERSRWKTSISRVIAETREAKQATVQESLDFFTKQWSDVEEEGEEDPTRDQPAQPLTANEPAETVTLLEQEFGSGADLGVLRTGKPLYIPWAIRKREETDLYFAPSTRKVPLHMKLEEGKNARNLEDEGLYVGERPSMPTWNQNIVENRLLRQGELQWFGEDGQVKTTPLPIPVSLGQPVGSPPVNDDLLLFKKPSLWEDWPGFNRGAAPWCLEVELSSLTFTHHPLFSCEHVLCSRLYTAHAAYLNLLLTEDLQTCLEHRLQALRSALRHLLDQVEASDDDAMAAWTRNKRLQHYLDEMRNVRATKDRWEAEGRSLLRGLLANWAELKRLREVQGYASTTLKLIVHQEETDREEDLREWDHQLEEELEEQDLLYRIEYSQQMANYESRQEEKKSQRSSSRRSRASAAQEESVDVSEPDTPEKFNTNKVLGRLREKALKNRRKPGEPKLVVELIPGVPITPTDQCPRSEQQRRNNVFRRKVMAKLFVNEMEVCQSSFRSLDTDFKVFWGQIFNVQLFHIPRTICIKIFEDISKDKELASIFLPVPEDSVTTESVSFQEIQFSNEKAVSPHQRAVGSAVMVSDSGTPQWLLTGGTLRCSCAWTVDPVSGQALAPNMKKDNQLNLIRLGELARALRKPGTNFKQPVSNQHYLDPNDPENSRLIGALQSLDFVGEQEEQDEGGFFQLNPWETELVSDQVLDSSPRFQLLSLRERDPEFSCYQMIPAYDSQIPHELVLATRKALTKVSHVDEDENLTHQTSAKEKALQQMNKAREQVKRQYLFAQKQYSLEDIVMEDKVPTIGSLGFNLLDLLRRRRPLRPKRKERKKMTGQGVASTEVKVLVTVMRATNVPVRTDRDTLLTEGKVLGSGLGMISGISSSGYDSQVQPFVEVMFQRETMRTSVAEGPHPTWNEQLTFRFKAPNDDYSPSSLEKVKDSLHLNLFDEVVVDLLEDDRDRESIVHQKLERRWLGSLTLPFSTLYLNTKIEGTFQVCCPPVLLGYEPETIPWFQGSERGGVEQDQTSHSITHLSLFFTLEPSLQLPDLKDRLTCPNDDDPFLQHALDWQSSLSSQFPLRPIKAVALDLSGIMTPITRYLRPLKPPEDLVKTDNLVATMDSLARFVSLIPNSPDSFVPGLGDIWTTCDHFFEMLSGDEEEHALLLCNFFLYLGLDAYLLLGSGIPEGLTAYVLCPLGNTDNSALWVWNATTGKRFPVRDSRSPLQRVGSVANSNNVWANIQKSDHPSRITFQLSKSKAWQPFFTNKFPHPGFSSIQPESLNYTAISPEEVEEMRSRLESSLSESLMQWRRRSRTSWNRHCSRALSRILLRLEKCHGKTAAFESLKELHPILSSHKLSGFPLNMPWTDEKAVADAVYATGVHLAEGPGLQFALAVHLHPYPCSVLSVWVYVATLMPRR